MEKTKNKTNILLLFVKIPLTVLFTDSQPNPLHYSVFQSFNVVAVNKKFPSVLIVLWSLPGYIWLIWLRAIRAIALTFVRGFQVISTTKRLQFSLFNNLPMWMTFSPNQLFPGPQALEKKTPPSCAHYDIIQGHHDLNPSHTHMR